ncbi:adenosine deaminase [Lactobacillus sp. S2-2]|uniref:adenosine deaminase n=1 Tax=Lactobacillus sp. S2-2 TaxID=2692917 RepID=UPI001F0029C8|nr:adenosine deaminase [Lactobacillus sp. S2-2]MCF6514724.1 adenosine deaminase [Lactobacillus sp. S2-2]
MLTDNFIQDFPKVDLHCHLDGSIRPSTLKQIADIQKIEINDSIDEVNQKMHSPMDAVTLEEYLQPFDYVNQFLQTKEALEIAAFDVMDQAFKDGVKYIEIRFAPSLSTKKDLSIQDTINAVANGISRAEKIYDITGNILICGMRNEELSEIGKVFDQSKGITNKVVGADLAGPEPDEYLSNFKSVYNLLVDQQEVFLTLHAGECGCIQNIYDAINEGAKRIGHGIAMKDDDKTQKYVSDNNVFIEGCPTSNLQTNAIEKYSEYPLKKWLNQGIKLTINTDNRTVSDINLTNEFKKLRDNCDMEYSDLIKLTNNAIDGAFTNDTIKNKLKELVNKNS